MVFFESKRKSLLGLNESCLDAFKILKSFDNLKYI